jgi:ribose 5-phosphate isomerase A
MRLGLGTGSTVAFLLEALAERRRAGLRFTSVATSVRTEVEARRLGIPVSSLDECPELDLAIDGADEVDDGLDCLKGLGGACLREKVVAAASRRFVLIADESKLVSRLGERAPVVVEALPFAVAPLLRSLADLNPVLRRAQISVVVASAAAAAPVLERLQGTLPPPWVTDNGNHLLELRTGPIPDPAGLAARLDAMPGVVGHGLFLGMAAAAYVATAKGLKRLERPRA